jgi:hypothetical protein
MKLCGDISILPVMIEISVIPADFLGLSYEVLHLKGIVILKSFPGRKGIDH